MSTMSDIDDDDLFDGSQLSPDMIAEKPLALDLLTFQYVPSPVKSAPPSQKSIAKPASATSTISVTSKPGSQPLADLFRTYSDELPALLKQLEQLRTELEKEKHAEVPGHRSPTSSPDSQRGAMRALQIEVAELRLGRNELTRVRSELSAVRDQLAEQTKLRDQAEKKLQTRDTDSNSRVTAAKSESERLQSQLNSLRQENQKMLSLSQQLLHEKEHSTSEMDVLRTELAENQNRVQVLQQQILSLREQLPSQLPDTPRRRTNRSTTQTTDIVQQMALTEQLVQEQRKSQQLADEITSLKGALTEASQRSAEKALQDEIAGLRNEVFEANEYAKQLQREIRRRETTIDEQAEKIAKYEAEIATLHTKLSTLTVMRPVSSVPNSPRQQPQAQQPQPQQAQQQSQTQISPGLQLTVPAQKRYVGSLFHPVAGSVGTIVVQRHDNVSPAMSISPQPAPNSADSANASSELSDLLSPAHKQETRHKIIVGVRLRPLIPTDRSKEVCWRAMDDRRLLYIPQDMSSRPQSMHCFDHMFGANVATPQIYEDMVSPLVRDALEGKNGMVVAYGITSSGKTYTMVGNETSPGVLPLAIQDIWQTVVQDEEYEFAVHVSYYEIFMEDVYDLLTDEPTDAEQLVTVQITQPHQMMELLHYGEARRRVACTQMNARSTHSHTIYRVMFDRTHLKSGDKVDSELNFVDLGGAERVEWTLASGSALKEASFINKSLFTMALVVRKLASGIPQHIPYRSSRLTHVLQPGLGGDARAAFICCMSPARNFEEHSRKTIAFAGAVGRIHNTVSVKTVKLGRSDLLLMEREDEVSQLKKQLAEMKRRLVAATAESHPAGDA